MNDEYGYVPQLPAVMAPTAPSGVEIELRRLKRARFANDPISSTIHRVSEWSSRKALEATAKRFTALKTATDNFTAAAQSMGAMQDTVETLQIQRELSRLRHEFGLQHAITQLHIEFNQDKEILHTAQRAAITAQHGVEAAVRFKEANFRIGETRKEAQIAETAELVGQPKQGDAAKDTATVETLFRLRSGLRADGKDTRFVDDAINEFGTRLDVTAE